jgi:2-polyprenyl-3-methyl-5-hydroxy-6-metoxy-1,4-benzoquinol methylase
MKKYKFAGYGDRDFTLDEIRYLVTEKKCLPVHKRVISEISGRKILDLGCNIGNSAADIARRYPSSTVIGVDNDRQLIEIAKDLYGDIGNLSFGEMSATDLMFNDNEYDCVIFLEVIEHLNDPVKALKEIYRVLKPNGKLVLATNNVYYSRFIARQIAYDLLGKKPRLMVHQPDLDWGTHLYAWDVSTLCTLLNANGFSYKTHYYVGSSGVYIGRTCLDRWLDIAFAHIFPFFRATVIIETTKKQRDDL